MSEFFRRVLPAGGPFTLLSGATGPDGKLAEQRHYNGLMTHADVEREVSRLSMQPVNVYFAVGNYAGRNRRDPISKRAFYLDLDSKDFNDSKEESLRQLSAFVRAVGLPAPSLYVDSGRGVHVYWALDRDLPITEWLPIAAALKAKHIELEFPADRTVTADAARILRAPGSLNRKGDTPIPCRVLADNGTSHNPETIAVALGVGKTRGMAKLAATVSNSDLSNKQEYDKLTADDIADMLDWVHLPTVGGRELWTTILCAIQDWSDKSEEGFELFAVWSAAQPGFVSVDDCRVTWESFTPGGGISIGTLVKIARDAGYKVPVVASPLTSSTPALAVQMAAPASPSGPVGAAPSLHVSTGVIASPLMIAAANAIQASGKPRFEHNDAVMWLANEFVVITDQDGLYYSVTNRGAMTRTVIDDLLGRYMPLNANGVPINATVLIRRYGTVHAVNSLGFYPGQPAIYSEHGKSYVNQYSQPADKIPPMPAEQALLDDFWNYCFPTQQDKEFGDYLRQFYAHIVQKPWTKIASAPLLISAEVGTGKTTLAYAIPRALVGIHNTRLVSNKVLRSAFSDYINGAHFLHFDEVHINGRWDSDDTANAMKNLITGTEVEVHPKGMKPFNIPNRVFITATSNYEDAMSLPSDNERRWGVYYLNPPPRFAPGQKEAYFDVLHRWVASTRGSGVLRYIFSQVDISTFNPQAPPPMTVAKSAMIMRSQSTAVQLVYAAAQDGMGPFAKDIFTADQVASFIHAQTGKTMNMLELRAIIKRALPSAIVIRQIREGGDRPNVYCHKDHGKWKDASPDDIRKELSR